MKFVARNYGVTVEIPRKETVIRKTALNATAVVVVVAFHFRP